MSTSYPDDGMCHETSGFLFNHKCDRFAVEKCLRCQKPLCDDHGHTTPEGTVCTSCLKVQAKEDRQKNPDKYRTGGYSYYDHYYYYDDPYFYGTHYYPGYGVVHVHSTRSRSDDSSSASVTPDSSSGGDLSNDPMDFTEGDAANLQREEDGDFETDMGAS